MLCDLSERPTEPESPLHSSRHSRQEDVPAIPSNSGLSIANVTQPHLTPASSPPPPPAHHHVDHHANHPANGARIAARRSCDERVRQHGRHQHSAGRGQAARAHQLRQPEDQLPHVDKGECFGSRLLLLLWYLCVVFIAVYLVAANMYFLVPACVWQNPKTPHRTRTHSLWL